MTEKIIRRENAFEQKKTKPGLSTNRPSNNWAQAAQHTIFMEKNLDSPVA